MNTKPSPEEQAVNFEGHNGGAYMELTRSQELIKRLKDVKAANEITYPRILERLEKINKPLSLTTLRRVFADGSEQNANNFSYENTLLPIAEVLLNVEDVPAPEDSPDAARIEALRAVIHTQNEEIVRMHEMKEHLESRITFLLGQIELKDRRMDEKDALIKQLLEKCL